MERSVRCRVINSGSLPYALITETGSVILFLLLKGKYEFLSFILRSTCDWQTRGCTRRRLPKQISLHLAQRAFSHN